MHTESSIPGVRSLLGAGVYSSMPKELPAALRDRDAIVGGATREAVDAVLRLADWCRAVTFIKPTSTRVAALRGRTNVTILHGAEIVCVDGIGQLESVVARKIRTGAVSAHSAAALFLLQ
jgi:thioredoxin reductase